MRDLLFRVWHEGKMQGVTITDDHLVCVREDNNDSVIIGNACSGYGSGLLKKYDSPVMQYTGIKDEHQNEVFEGDILRLSNNHEYTYVVKHGNYFECQNGKLDAPECFGFYLLKLDDMGKTYNIKYAFLEDMEIIGNIYENPELIKKREEDKNER